METKTINENSETCAGLAATTGSVVPRKSWLWKLSGWELTTLVLLEVFGLGFVFLSANPLFKLIGVLSLQLVPMVLTLWRVGEEVLRPPNGPDQRADP